MRYELVPRYDKAQSFYGKAHVEEKKNGDLVLYSYDTKILTITKSRKLKKHYNDYTQTTMRHINDFLLQNDFKKLSKKEWLEI